MMTSPWSDVANVALLVKQGMVSADGTKIRFTLPGIDFEDFYQYGDVSPWKVMKYFTVMRILAACRTGFCMNEIVDAEHTAFLVQSDVTITPSFYSVTRASRMWTPLQFSLELLSVGKSTVNLRGSIHGVGEDGEKTDTRPLVSAVFTSVRVNLTTRRSAQLPDTFQKRYSKFFVSNASRSDRHRPSPEAQSTSMVRSVQTDLSLAAVPVYPDSRQSIATHDVFSSVHFIVRPSDCDSNKHTANFVYVRYCLDSATLLACASRQEVTSQARGVDMSALRVNRIKSRFIRESRLGDVIRVTTRSDDRCTRTLHFRLSRDDDLLFELSVEFQESVVGLIQWRNDVSKAKL